MFSTSLYNCQSHLHIISVMTGIFTSKLLTMFQLQSIIYSMSIFSIISIQPVNLPCAVMELVFTQLYLLLCHNYLP